MVTECNLFYILSHRGTPSLQVLFSRHRMERGPTRLNPRLQEKLTTSPRAKPPKLRFISPFVGAPGLLQSTAREDDNN